MSKIKGLKPIEIPKGKEIHLKERPQFVFRGEQYFPLVGKKLEGDLAESGVRLKEMTLTPDLNQRYGAKIMTLSLTETKTQKNVSTKLAITAIVLAGVLGVVIKNPEIVAFVADRIKALGAILGWGLLPILGMAVGDGNGGGKKDDPSKKIFGLEKPAKIITGKTGVVVGESEPITPPDDVVPDVTLESVLEELETKAMMAENMVTLLEKRGAPEDLLVGWREEAKEAREAAELWKERFKERK